MIVRTSDGGSVKIAGEGITLASVDGERHPSVGTQDGGRFSANARMPS